MSLSPEELEIQEEAIAYARKHKKQIANALTDPEQFPPEQNPVSVFMAGSPGAGKTEASLELIGSMAAKGDGTPVLIDPDEYRQLFPGYNGSNAYLFQGAVSILVGRLLDRVFDQSQSFLLDGTLTSMEVADKNIARSLRKDRPVQVLYVYQRPDLAWGFVQAREAKEGRRIPKDRFIDQYFAARDVVNALKEKHGKAIKVDVLIKDNDNSRRNYHANVDQIDSHVPERYTKSEVENLINEL